MTLGHEKEDNSIMRCLCNSFLRYFTLFMNLLNDCADASQQLEKNSPWQEAEASKLNSLRNAIIQAISNLLSANIDSGLMHSIGKVHRVCVCICGGGVFFLSVNCVCVFALFSSGHSSCSGAVHETGYINFGEFDGVIAVYAVW